jgi:parallel beta-helix repeat protein
MAILEKAIGGRGGVRRAVRRLHGDLSQQSLHTTDSDMKRLNTPSLAIVGAALGSLLLSTQLTLAQGSLTPPGAPAPTMKTLAQIEPRTPISTLPFNIKQPGSYYLTTNLMANPGGITIWTNGVTLDLMGFELSGEGGSSTGIGLLANVDNICIRNGSVSGWLYDGINLATATNCLVQDLRLSRNGGHGLVVGDACEVIRCAVSMNRGDGIVGGFGCSILNSTTYTNGTNGIRIRASGVVRNCVTLRNGRSGLIAEWNSTVSDCSAGYNGWRGIHIGSGGTVSGCSSYANKSHGITDDTGTLGIPGLSVANCSATYNEGDGIYLINGSAVKNCLAKGNKGDGIETVYGSTITDCSGNDNQGSGIKVEAQGIIDRCAASGNSTNGIEVAKQSAITGCTVRANHLHGIYASGNGNRIDGNTVSDNYGDGISLLFSAIKNVVVRNSSSDNVGYEYRVPGLPGQFGGPNVVGPVSSDASSANAWANFSP